MLSTKCARVWRKVVPEVCRVIPSVQAPKRVFAKRCTAASSSFVFSSAAEGSPDAIAPATQCDTWSSSTLSATELSAVVAAEIWVRTSMQ